MNTIKKFSQYTDAELIDLPPESIEDSIRLEAIDRGIRIPVALSEALRTTEFAGFQRTGDHAAVYEILAPNRWGAPEATGVAYLSEARAEAALEGAVSIRHETYGPDAGPHVNPTSNAWRVAKVCIPSLRAVTLGKHIVPDTQDTKDFDDLAESCLSRIATAKQAAYNARVLAERKAEYLRLANGDEAVAKAFWGKVEQAAWPA